MSNTYTLSVSMSVPGQTIAGQSSQATEGGNFIDAAFGANQTDKQYNISFPADVNMLVAWSDVDCVLDFNSTSTPAPSLALAANKPFVLDSTQPYASLFTEAITKVYLTAVLAGKLKIYPAFDPTP